MANRSYLCGTDLKTLYPSFVDKAYAAGKQTLANDVWCVPLLWTALFRENEIEATIFKTDEGPVSVEAPVTTREQALVNLRDALPFFNALFKQEGSVNEYARFLFRAIKASPYKYVTIEMEEIASLTDEEEYYATFRKALSSIGGPPSSKLKKVFMEIANFRNLKRFPPADLRLHQRLLEEASADDNWNHCRVCGAGAHESGLGRSVPWEPPI